MAATMRVPPALELPCGRLIRGSANGGGVAQQSENAPALHPRTSVSTTSSSRQRHGSRRSLKSLQVSRAATAAAAAAASPAIAPPSPPKSKSGFMRPSLAALAKTVLELAAEGTLCFRFGDDGFPLGAHVAYVLDSDDQPILLLRSNDLSVSNVEKDGRCSLHVQVELPGLQKPQVTVCGTASQPADDASIKRLEVAWQRRYGEEFVAGEGSGCSLWLLSIDRLLVAQDVDQDSEWVNAEDYLAAEADPLREAARKIVEDFNREHWQDLRRFPWAFAGVNDDVEDASMTWVDRFGFDLRVWLRPSASDSTIAMRDVRIPFASQVVDEREARSALTMMAQVSWERERNYNPVVPSSVSVASPDQAASK